jgi:hypothetical protein
MTPTTCWVRSGGWALGCIPPLKQPSGYVQQNRLFPVSVHGSTSQLLRCVISFGNVDAASGRRQNFVSSSAAREARGSYSPVLDYVGRRSSDSLSGIPLVVIHGKKPQALSLTFLLEDLPSTVLAKQRLAAEGFLYRLCTL